MANQSLSLQLNPLLRVAGQAQPLCAFPTLQEDSGQFSMLPAREAHGNNDDPSSRQAHNGDIVHQASVRGTDPASPGPAPTDPAPTAPAATQPDSTLVDLTLHVDAAAGPCPAPPLGVGYAGLSPRQRYRFLHWATTDVTHPAPPAFQQLYCAHLEARLLESAHTAAAVHAELPRLAQAAAWADSGALARTQLLAFWLAQDGAGLAAWMGLNLRLADLAGVALGMQAILGQPLDGREVAALAALWPIVPPGALPLPQDVLNLHLSSLENSLGQRLLTHVLEQLPEAAHAPKPWRANHRGLRLRVPQPDLRSRLLPLLRDLYSMPGQEIRPAPVLSPATQAEEALPDRGWQLILEFGNSRSEYFDLVMRAAQKLPDYNQLMDENRQLVHRISFKRSELRRFWRIWDYVQTWSSSRVYVNGVELEKWKVWPYSQYLQ